MNTKSIIDKCLLSIGEPYPATPIDLTRAECLELINYAYQVEIGEKLNILKMQEYDGSDAARTITAGVGSLPADFLAVDRVYDGDPDSVKPLEQIFDVEDKVRDDATTTQYMIPSETQFWIFGLTPTNNVRMYYRSKPAALVDNEASIPVHLKEKYHLQAFTCFIKMIYADRMDNFNDYLSKKAEWLDILDAIEVDQRSGRRDKEPARIKRVMW